MTDSRNRPVNQARLTTLVDQAGELMDQLSSISDGQRDAIKAVDVEQIVEYVARREPVVSQLVTVGEEIAAVIQSFDEGLQKPDVSYNDALTKIASIEHAMKRLREQDAQDQQLMEEAREKLASQLASTGTNQNAMRAYSSRPNTPNPTLQDRQG